MPKPEWVDSETGNAFSEGTELLYADMNVDRGDTFRSFTMRDNVVTPFERKVYGIVTTLWPNEDNYAAVLFCKENGKLDGTICYIDGFGFYGTREEHSGDFKSHVHRFYNSKSETNYTIWESELGMARLYEVPDEVKAGVVMPTVKHDPREGIYTIEGIRLNVNRDELPAGFYIINGKKTFVN